MQYCYILRIDRMSRFTSVFSHLHRMWCFVNCISTLSRTYLAVWGMLNAPLNLKAMLVAALLLIWLPILDRFLVRCMTRSENLVLQGGGVGLGAVIHIPWKLTCLETPAAGRSYPKKGQRCHRRKGRRLFMMWLIAREDFIVWNYLVIFIGSTLSVSPFT